MPGAAEPVRSFELSRLGWGTGSTGGALRANHAPRKSLGSDPVPDVPMVVVCFRAKIGRPDPHQGFGGAHPRAARS